MATFKRATKIPARPQIKAAKQSIPRQVILPQKAQPVVSRNIGGKKTSVAPTNVPMRPAVLANTTAQMPATLNPFAGQDLQSLFQRMQNQITNPTNPLYNSNPQTNEPAQAPTRVNYESYGFDKGLVDYLNNQRQQSYYDGGISYEYDPTTQTFRGGAMGGPVTKTLAQIQAEAQNYANRPAYDPNNPLFRAGGGQLGVAQNPLTRAPVMGESSVGTIGYPAGGGTTTYQSGFGQPLVPYTPNLPSYQNTQPFNGIQQMQGQLGMQPQQNFGSMPNYNQQGLGSMGQSAYNPMMGNNMAQPFNQTMPQTGFVPMGGYDPQNTSYGSFGAIQQPMGGFQNIGSLLGMG